MPCIDVHRNFPMDQEDLSILQDRLIEIVEHILKKPKAFIMVILEDQKPIRFGGSDEPALFLEVKSIGLPGDSPARLSEEICQAVEALTAVPADRVYIEFTDSPRHMWGWDGGTF